MTQANILIEGYHNGSMRDRFLIRKQSMDRLISSNEDVLSNPIYLKLIEEEASDFKRKKVITSEIVSDGRINNSKIITFTKALLYRKNAISISHSLINAHFINEILSKRNLSGFQIDLFDWMWRGVLEIDSTATRLVRRKTLNFLIRMFISGLHVDGINGLTNEEIHNLLETEINEYFTRELHRDSVQVLLYLLLSNAFLYLEEKDMTNFEYFLLKANEYNAEHFAFSSVIHLLNNQMVTNRAVAL